MFIRNQFDRVFTSAGKARVPPWTVCPQGARNADSGRETPAFGGPNRLVGGVAMLARCTASHFSSRLADKPVWLHQTVPYEHEAL